jgi:hypothetical protein
MFAIDGVKLPSNASKHRSGTRAEFAAQATKLEASAKTMLARHRAEDVASREPDLVAKEAARITRLELDAADIRRWLAAHPTDRRGPTGGLRKSNRTVNESAKMATANGVLQGYTRRRRRGRSPPDRGGGGSVRRRRGTGVPAADGGRDGPAAAYGHPDHRRRGLP